MLRNIIWESIETKNRKMKKNIIITHYQYQKLVETIKRWKYYNNFDEYRRLNEDDTFEFLSIPTKTTGLHTTVLVDDEGSFVHFNHPLWLYVVEKNATDDTKLIPISISKNPQLLVSESYCSIPPHFINEVKLFIIKNFQALYEYGHGNIDMSTFYRLINQKKSQLNENLLFEMPTLSRKVTGLPTEIWVDSKRSKKHGDRIKFKDVESNNTNNWATMTIDAEEPEVRNLHNSINLLNKEIEVIKDFVRYNYDILDMASNNPNMDFEMDFKPLMFTISKNGNVVVPQSRMNQLYNHDDMVIIDCSLGFDNRVYFIANDTPNSGKIIQELGKNKLFHANDKYSVYLDLNDFPNENSYSAEYNAIAVIKTIAKANNIELKFINLNNI